MIDLNKKREAFERFHAKECNCSYESLKRQLDRQEALTGTDIYQLVLVMKLG